MSNDVKPVAVREFSAASALLGADADATTEENRPTEDGENVAQPSASPSLYLNTPFSATQAIAVAMPKQELKSKMEAWAFLDGLRDYTLRLRRQVESLYTRITG